MDKTSPSSTKHTRPSQPASIHRLKLKASATPKKHTNPDATETALEATSFLHGLFHEFQQQKQRYAGLAGELLSLEARIELVEKTLCLTRDHLAMSINKTDSAIPRDWAMVLSSVRFVGMRLADACLTLLRENQKMTPKEIVCGLNTGMFRFRTSSPQREIHAALLRQTSVKRVGNYWTWVGDGEQIKMRFRVVKAGDSPSVPSRPDQFEESGG